MTRRKLRWPGFVDSQVEAPPKPLWVRLLWMMAIWAGSIAALALVALLLRLVLLG